MTSKTLQTAIMSVILSSQLLASDSPHSLSLAGEWRLALDPDRKGEESGWWTQQLADTILLPGTLAERKNGPRKAPAPVTRELSSEYTYVGAAWYQTDIAVPEAWVGKPGIIHIEQSKISRAWLGDRFLGSSDALGVPQEFHIESFPEGTHALTIMVDSEQLPPGGAGGHMITTSRRPIVERVRARLV